MRKEKLSLTEYAANAQSLNTPLKQVQRLASDVLKMLIVQEEVLLNLSPVFGGKTQILLSCRGVYTFQLALEALIASVKLAIQVLCATSALEKLVKNSMAGQEFTNVSLASLAQS